MECLITMIPKKSLLTTKCGKLISYNVTRYVEVNKTTTQLNIKIDLDYSGCCYLFHVL